MKSGPRDDLITIERNNGSNENAFGEPVEAWVELAQEWAQTFYGSGSESRKAASEGAEQTASFEVDYNPTTLSVTEADRIIFGGVWDITQAYPLGRKGVRITAVRRRAA